MQKHLKNTPSQSNTMKRKAEDSWRSHMEIVVELGTGHFTPVRLFSDSKSEPESDSQGMADDV
jgi:hypothetical protein